MWFIRQAPEPLDDRFGSSQFGTANEYKGFQLNDRTHKAGHELRAPEPEALKRLSLDSVIDKRDRAIEGLYLVLESLGVDRFAAWQRAELLLAAKPAAVAYVINTTNGDKEFELGQVRIRTAGRGEPGVLPTHP